MAFLITMPKTNTEMLWCSQLKLLGLWQVKGIFFLFVFVYYSRVDVESLRPEANNEYL